MGACCCCPSLPPPPASLPDLQRRREGSRSESIDGGDESRAYLMSLSVESLAWKSQSDRDGKRFYFSVLTGETVWERPDGYVARGTRNSRDIVSADDLPHAQRACAERGIELRFAPFGQTLCDETYGYNVRGFHPKLAHCLFYQPLLVAGLSLYPPEFVRRSGLKTIVLVDNLYYSRQERRAIPVAATGTLYLDPSPEVIYYLQDVLHHEYFHIIDANMMKANLFDSKGTVEGQQTMDREWQALNSPNFRYGNGGMHDRDHGAFISPKTVVPGFLNRYSTTAVEEDKAEVFAGLMRHPGALVEGSDHILRQKSLEMMRRLHEFCPPLDSSFWLNVAAHEPYAVGRQCQEGTWEVKDDKQGHKYWYNELTQQISWIDPHLQRGFSKPLPNVISAAHIVISVEEPGESSPPSKESSPSSTHELLAAEERRRAP